MGIEKYVSAGGRAAIISLSLLLTLGACAFRTPPDEISNPAIKAFQTVVNVASMPLLVPLKMLLGMDEGELTVKKKECVTKDENEYCGVSAIHAAPWDLFGSTKYELITRDGQRTYENIQTERFEDQEKRVEKVLTLYLARDIGGSNMEYGDIVELLVYEGKKIGALEITFINPRFEKEKWAEFEEKLGTLDLSGNFLFYSFFDEDAAKIVETYGEGAREPLDEFLRLLERAGLGLEDVLEQE